MIPFLAKNSRLGYFFNARNLRGEVNSPIRDEIWFFLESYSEINDLLLRGMVEMNNKSSFDLIILLKILLKFS